MTRTGLGLLAAAIALGVGGRAAATILVAAFTGTVSSGTDVAGLFGAKGADLTGDAYTAIYTFNTAIGVYEDDLPSYDEVYGGMDYNDISPVAAVLTINGVTKSLGGAYLGSIEASSSFDVTEALAENYKTLGSIATEDSMEISASGATSGTVLDPLPFGFTSNSGNATFEVSDLYTGQVTELERIYLDSQGTLSISALPEPATWAMMLLGVGVVGAAMRGTRRRSMA
jgi:hypothetical protein